MADANDGASGSSSERSGAIGSAAAELGAATADVHGGAFRWLLSRAEPAGDEAGLTLARALRPKAMLRDVERPEMDGWSMLHTLRQDPGPVDTPTVMVSVKTERSLALALGATDHLPKPVDRDRLKRGLDRIRPQRDGTTLVIAESARMRLAPTRDGRIGVEAGCGRRALERLDGTAPSLIDSTMPVMDGVDVLKRLRQRPDGGLVPVVVLTAKDVTPDETDCLDRQAERIIAKGSVSLPDLAQDLRELIPAPGR